MNNKILFVYLLLCFSIGLLSKSKIDECSYYLPGGWSLPDKSQFTFQNEKNINLGVGPIKNIIQREYKYLGQGEGYSFYIQRFNDNCIWLDEFLRIIIKKYTEYIVILNNKEYVLFYEFINTSVGKAYCEGEYSTTDIDVGYSILLSNVSMNGVFDRLSLLYPDLNDLSSSNNSEEGFPYKSFFIKLLSFYDLSVLGK